MAQFDTEGFVSGFLQQQLSPQGFLGQTLADQEQKRKNKLQLALESAQIEQRLGQKQRELDMEKASKTIPTGQFQDTLAFQQGTLPANQLNVTDPTAQASALGATKGLPVQSLKSQNRPSSRPVYRQIPDPSGKGLQLVKIDPSTDKVTVLREGVSPQTAASVAKIEGDFSAADATLDEFKKYAEPLLVSGNIAQTLPQGIKTRLSAVAQTDPLASAFLDMREKFALDLTALVSGKQMTEEERKAILRALPGPEDSLETAQLKLESFERVYNNTREKKVEAYLGKPKESNRPLGGMSKSKATPDISISAINAILEKRKASKGKK